MESTARIFTVLNCCQHGLICNVPVTAMYSPRFPYIDEVEITGRYWIATGEGLVFIVCQGADIGRTMLESDAGLLKRGYSVVYHPHSYI